MALRIEYEQEALEDIVAAGESALERFGEATASDFLERVREVVGLIATQPEMGRTAEIPTHPRLGEFQFFPLSDFPFIVFYSYDDQTLRIYGVIYAAMDLPTVFRERWADES